MKSSVCNEIMPGSLGIKQEIIKAFKLHGYTLKVEASKHLEHLLTPIQDRSKWIEAILDTLSKKDLQSANLDKQIIEKVIKVTMDQSVETAYLGYFLMCKFSLVRYLLNLSTFD